RIEALRLLLQLDPVDAERRDAGRLRLVRPALDPDEPPVLLRDAAQQIRPVPAQRAGERGRRPLALLPGGEGARIDEDRVDVLGDREGRAVAVGDLPPPRRPLDLPARLLAGEPREPRPVEKLHLGRAQEHDPESGEDRRGDEERAEPEEAGRRPSGIATRLPHVPSYWAANSVAVRAARSASTTTRSPAGGPILSRPRESSAIRCGLVSCATRTSRRSCSREPLWCSAERRESR